MQIEAFFVDMLTAICATFLLGAKVPPSSGQHARLRAASCRARQGRTCHGLASCKRFVQVQLYLCNIIVAQEFQVKGFRAGLLQYAHKKEPEGTLVV